MQFRDRGSIVCLVRTSFDAETKTRSVEEVARVLRPELELSDSDRARLTAEELEEFESYRGKEIRSLAIERDYAAHRLPETLELVSGWLSAAPREEALAFCARLQRPFKKLRRQIASLTNTGEAPAKAAKKQLKLAKLRERGDDADSDDGMEGDC